MNIRNEIEADYEKVEEITRKAFYNLYVPGCTEHYLVHIMRSHKDFIPELDFVMEADGEIIGNIMYTKTCLRDESGAKKDILTFGPVSILPEHQRKGLGKKLMEHSFKKALEMGYDTIVIFGSPSNYVSCGFKSCKKYGVSLEGGAFPTAMLVKELIPGVLDGRKWVYHQGTLFEDFDEEKARQYDDSLEPMEKKHTAAQEEFYINSNSVLQ